MDHKTMWIHATYLIEAKKSIDSLMFLQIYKNRLRNIDLKSVTVSIYNKFYLNCCYVLDRVLINDRASVRKTDEIIKSIYKERNQNRAHKDKKYIAPEFKSLEKLISGLQRDLEHVREVCNDQLPEKLTFDYVPFDQILFRLVYRVNDEYEEIIKNKKLNDNIDYVFRNKINIDYFRSICGINIYETLQKSQHECICKNINLGTDDWYKLNNSYVDNIKRLQELKYLDVFENVVPNYQCDENTAIEIRSILESM